MKFVITIFLLCAALKIDYILADEDDMNSIYAIAEACKTETGASDADVTAMFKHEALTTTEAKCLRACAMKKGGLMNEEGHLNQEAIMQLTKLLAKGDEEKENKGKDVAEQCAKTEFPEDHCEAAEVYAECLRTLSKEKGLTSMEFDK